MNVEAFVQMLPYIGRGMLGVFLVIFVIMLTVVLLNLCTGRRRQSSGAEQSEKAE